MNKIIVSMVAFFITWLILHSFSFTMIGAPAAGLFMYPFYLICFIFIYAFIYAIVFQFGRYFLGEDDAEGEKNRYFLAQVDKSKHSKNTLIKTASKSFTLAGKIISGAFVTLFIGIGLLVLLFKYDAYKREQASFHKSYTVRNYHDSNITFYENSLDLYSKKFVNERDKSEIFQTYIKREMALECIGYFLKNHLDDQRTYRMRGNFDRSYRNKYATNEALIDHVIDNSDFIKDVKNLVYIPELISRSIYHDRVNECQNLTDVEVLYPTFKSHYISKIKYKIKRAKADKNYDLSYKLKSKVDSYEAQLEMLGE